MDQPLASKLARQAFDHWQAGRLSESAALYEEALPLADPKHYAIPEYHAEYACVLEALGRSVEALAELELAARTQREQDGSDTAVATSTARYFLADHLLKHKQPERALAEVAPSLASSSRVEWLLRLLQAEAFAALNRSAEARSAAARSLEAAPNEAKRQELVRRFTQLGVHGGPVA